MHILSLKDQVIETKGKSLFMFNFSFFFSIKKEMERKYVEFLCLITLWELTQFTWSTRLVNLEITLSMYIIFRKN